MKNYSGEAKPFQVLKSERVFQWIPIKGTPYVLTEEIDKHCLAKKAQGNVRYDSKYGGMSEWIGGACHCASTGGI